MNESLIAVLREQGGILSELLDPSADTATAPSRPPNNQQNHEWPRVRGREAEYELLLEMILEGSRLHYGEPRYVRTEDRDLALLLGDQLYALGLARLAAIGDLEAVAELADVISLTAQAHAACDGELADAVWDAGVAAIACGGTETHAAAKELARSGDPRALSALRGGS